MNCIGWPSRYFHPVEMNLERCQCFPEEEQVHIESDVAPPECDVHVRGAELRKKWKKHPALPCKCPLGQRLHGDNPKCLALHAGLQGNRYFHVPTGDSESAQDLKSEYGCYCLEHGPGIFGKRRLLRFLVGGGSRLFGSLARYAMSMKNDKVE